MNNVYMLSLLFLIGCSSALKNYDPNSFDRAKNGVFFGNISVVLNGKPLSNCYLEIQDASRNSYVLDLSTKDVIYGLLPVGSTNVQSISCESYGFFLNEKFKIKLNSTFLVTGGTEKNYIGDYIVKVESPDFSFVDILLNRTKESKNISITLEDKSAAALLSYQKQKTDNSKGKIKKSFFLWN